jgi:IclR family transcriptional regulator, KDG regulon repressor
MKTRALMPKGGYVVAPVWKALQVLEFVAESGRAVSLTEAAEAVGLPKTTVFRYLHTLSASTFLQHKPSEDRYELGARFRALARTDRSLNRLREVSLPIMRDLLQQFDETINLAIESDGAMIYIEVVESTRHLRIGARIGSREPMHTTALGKAFLAYLDDTSRDALIGPGSLSAKTYRSLRDSKVLRRQLASVRDIGYAVETGENEDGAICIGVPILDDLSRPIAALSLSAPVRRQTKALLERASKALTAAGQTITKQVWDTISLR